MVGVEEVSGVRRQLSRLARGAALSAPLVVACGAAMVAERQFRFIPDFGPFEFGSGTRVATSSPPHETTSTTSGHSAVAANPVLSRASGAVGDSGAPVTTKAETDLPPFDGGPPPTTEPTVPTTVVAPPPTTPVPAVSHAPMAVVDEISAKRNTTIHIDVLANDFDLDGDLDPLSVTVTGGPSGPSAEPGSLSMKTRNGRDEIDYRLPFATGEFTFTYQVCDAAGVCSSADVRVIVTT